MTFESEEQLRREKKAIETFVKTFGGSYQKLDPLDIDYKISDKDNRVVAYAEVVSRVRTMRDSYPLPIDAKKLVKLFDKRLNPVLIWSCEDGIIYGRPDKLTGVIKQDTSGELMVYYEKQRGFKYVRFT